MDDGAIVADDIDSPPHPSAFATNAVERSNGVTADPR